MNTYMFTLGKDTRFYRGWTGMDNHGTSKGARQLMQSIGAVESRVDW